MIDDASIRLAESSDYGDETISLRRDALVIHNLTKSQLDLSDFIG